MNNDLIKIGERTVGDGEPGFVIAEVGQAHDGSLGMAHAYIDAVADAGGDAVKFQTHIADAESTRDEPFRIQLSGQDQSRFEYWRRMEFSPEQWGGLNEHARKRDVAFLSSAFSKRAVDILEKIGVPAWKVGSGEVQSNELLDAMAATGKPVLLSSGLSTFEELGEAVRRCRDAGAPVATLQCTTRYPVDMEQVGLNVIDELKTRFRCPAGLSDHSGSIWPSVAALAIEASLIEVHVVFDRRAYGPDVSSSITIDELAQLVSARDAISAMKQNPVDKDAMAEGLEDTRALFHKSVALTKALPAGTVLTADALTTKKPGTGIPATESQSLIGRRLRNDVPADRLLRPEDLHD